MSSKSKRRPGDRIAEIHNLRVTGMAFEGQPPEYARARIDIHLPDIGLTLAMSDTLAAQLRDDLTTNLNDQSAMRKLGGADE
jgi:hypothetical protein